jgi:hydrophobe/amphiphile efflux-1 (HAE1) family protein
MKISDFAIKKPVASIVISIAIILFGIIGFRSLGIRLYPAIDPPVISVRTSYAGASPEIIESQITEPLEKVINGIEGVKSISSSSSLGSSSINVEFNVGADLEKAANDVRNKTSEAGRNLPQDLDSPPVVSKSDANGEPIINVAVQSTILNGYELSDFAENILQEKLQTIPDVSSVVLFGQRRPAMRLWLDPNKMAAYNVTAQDIFNVLKKENVELPGGKIRGESTEFIVKTRGRLNSENEFNNLIIRQSNDQIIRFSDIGYAIVGPENEETSAKFNGVEGISLGIVPLPGANEIKIADEFYKRLEEIKKNLPEGTTVDVGFDKTKFERQSVRDVTETLFIAILLVVIIIYLFFRDWSIALRPLIDIPVSLIGTFFIMYMFGFSINVLTLLAIVLATGLVVDDCIVVTENIYKKLEEGMDNRAAALYGTREIFFAVISTSLTLAVVFIPVTFLEGFTGRLFREFGIVIAGAVLISAVVSLTLTPVLNMKMGSRVKKHSRFYLATESFFVGLDNLYRSGLGFFMKRKWISVAIALICVAMVIIFSSLLKSELAPLEDHSTLSVNVTTPEGTDYDYTQKVMDKLTQRVMDSVPEARLVYSRTSSGSSGGTNSGYLSIYLKEPDQRKKTQQQIFDKLSKSFKRNSEARVIASQEQTISTSSGRGGGGGMPVQFILQNLDFEKIRENLPKFIDEVNQSPVFSNSDVNLKFNKPELNVSIDRLKASDMGINVSDISSTLQLALSGGRYGYFLRNGKQYQIIGQVEREERMKPTDISSLYVRNVSGNLVQLDNLVNVEENSSPSTLYHYNRFKSATVSAALAPGYSLGEGIAEMTKISKRVLDDSFHSTLGGSSRDFAESSSNMTFTLLFALLLIYLLLATQFESFRDPLIIMITVPLAVAGALLSLWIFGSTLNIFSEIGIVMLIGLVTKNGILIVDFANKKRESGLSKSEAVFEAAAGRLRPILMTSLATIFGALPIAFALGAGATSRVPLGIVIVGGLLFALILTLFVIPIMYIFIAPKTYKADDQESFDI